MISIYMTGPANPFAFPKEEDKYSSLQRLANLKKNTPFLASQDALEVMRVTYLLSH